MGEPAVIKGAGIRGLMALTAREAMKFFNQQRKESGVLTTTSATTSTAYPSTYRATTLYDTFVSAAQCPVCRKNFAMRNQGTAVLPLTITDLICSQACINEYKLGPMLLHVEDIE